MCRVCWHLFHDLSVQRAVVRLPLHADELDTGYDAFGVGKCVSTIVNMNCCTLCNFQSSSCLPGCVVLLQWTVLIGPGTRRCQHHAVQTRVSQTRSASSIEIVVDPLHRLVPAAMHPVVCRTPVNLVSSKQCFKISNFFILVNCISSTKVKQVEACELTPKARPII